MNLKQLIKKVEREFVKKCDGIGQPLGIKLNISLTHDYCTLITGEILVGDMENGKVVEIKAGASEFEDALIDFLVKIGEFKA